MKPKLILMFTHNDLTVADAQNYFDMVKDLDVDYYGFKETGLAPAQIKSLVKAIHAIGKEVFLEVVKYDTAQVKQTAKLAAEVGFDCLSTIYCSSVQAMIGKKMRYFPFCGKFYGRPLVLDGTIEEIAQEAKRLARAGVDGLNIPVYRYKYPQKMNQMVSRVKEAVRLPIVSAGSINSCQRLEQTLRQGVWGFTIGGAFFEKKFAPQGSFRDNVAAVIDKLKDHG